MKGEKGWLFWWLIRGKTTWIRGWNERWPTDFDEKSTIQYAFWPYLRALKSLKKVFVTTDLTNTLKRPVSRFFEKNTF